MGSGSPTGRNVISGNTGAGVQIDGVATTPNGVVGNYIGAAAGGVAALGNGLDGVFITGSTNNVVANNVLSGNTRSGLRISLSTATGNLARGNKIGVGPTGGALGNGGDGVTIALSASSNAIGGTFAGFANTIANNGGRGGRVGHGECDPTQLDHGQRRPIDLLPAGPAANDRATATSDESAQNFPVVSAPTGSSLVNGTLHAAASTAYTIEFFASAACDASNFGEGASFIGDLSVTTDSTGTTTFAFTPSAAIPSGHVVTATATDPSGNTSEFSRCGGLATPSDQIQGLVSDVEGLNLQPKGIETSLVAKLQAALASLAAGDTATACDELNAFINQVQAQAGKKITQTDADALIQSAQAIRAALGCP